MYLQVLISVYLQVLISTDFNNFYLVIYKLIINRVIFTSKCTSWSYMHYENNFMELCDIFLVVYL